MANASTNLTSAAREVQVLKIDGYNACKSMCTAKKGYRDDGFIESRWNVGGHEWEVRMYPATVIFGAGYGEPLWLALKLVIVGKPGVRAALGCRLVDPRGLLEPSEEKSVSTYFGSCNSCTEAILLIETRDLAASGYLRGDSLSVECSVTVLRELPVPTIPFPAKEAIVPPSTNLHLHFGELLQSGTGADVTFIVSGESFAAHKLILSARSPVFMVEFFGDMKEKTSQSVEIEDMEATVFKTLLHFIYTDTVPELEKEQEESTVMSQHLLAAADRYGLDRLKLICEAKLSRVVAVDTAATTLALAEQHNCLQLKGKCVEFILSSPAILDAVLLTEGYKHLAASCPLVLADLLKSAHGRKC
ncbi:BTB/POZ and MATH domain-containing protein 1-like [Lolium rigidum]|uniref:BTB/POZ and MATH domain-containing protein 1-like n=1 Tax=Lolium rigidum TaxID=89674 RepID=UPI001F5CD478|nr:BTB/POZ and MATH domain-containing protein 1-like [Lolium rigidum]